MYEEDKVLSKGSVPGKRKKKHKGLKEETKEDHVKEPCDNGKVPR